MWRSEYLLSLREQTQALLKGPRITATENLRRGKWKIGRITELIKSRDKKIRSANIVVDQHKILKRAINLL